MKEHELIEKIDKMTSDLEDLREDVGRLVYGRPEEAPSGFTLQKVYNEAWSLMGFVPISIRPCKLNRDAVFVDADTGAGTLANIARPQWLTDALPLPLFDWPDWGECVTMDKGGFWYYWANTPRVYQENGRWAAQKGEHYRVLSAAHTPWLPAAGLPWESTLIKRPEGV